MPQPSNVMEIFKLLDKSNCGQCGEKTCLAFASAVFMGQKRLTACPKLDRETLKRFAGPGAGRAPEEDERIEYLQRLQGEIAEIDLEEAQQRVGGRLAEGRLIIKVLGKDFSVDASGKLSASIHINPWVAIPVLNYILYSAGKPASGNWVSFRELKGGRQRYPLFRKRCEEALKRVADIHTDLFDDMVHIFSGRQVARHFDSDISVVLRPLPKVPLLVCYWKPDEGLASSLHVFFDQSADDNLDIGSVFTLGAGLAQMFTKLALRHGVAVRATR
jgi:hypothetical protein